MVETTVNVKALELKNSNGVIDSSLIRPLVKLLVSTNKSQFRLIDDPDSDKWEDCVMNGENFTIYEDKLDVKSSGKSFTLRSDVLKMITEYKFNTTIPQEANW